LKIGIATEETWDFLHDIYKDLCRQYQVNVFKRRTTIWPIFRDRRARAIFRKDLRRFMDQNDVVFFEWASALLVAATKLPKTCGIVTRLHRYEMYQWANQVDWDVVDKVILVSHAKKREFIERFPSQADKIIVSVPSTSLEKFTPGAKTFNGDIGILCHLTPRKRVYDLILTFYELLQQKKDLHLHIGGGMAPAFEDYYYALKSIVADLGIQDKVTFYGNVKETWDWYHKIDIFISNSYSEGLQVAPMEAMASGCYCLVHRWRGADELVPDENLYYTSTELQKKILQYCEIPEHKKLEQKKRMRLLAQKRFDINQTIKQITTVIGEVAASPVLHNK